MLLLTTCIPYQAADTRVSTPETIHQTCYCTPRGSFVEGKYWETAQCSASQEVTGSVGEYLWNPSAFSPGTQSLASSLMMWPHSPFPATSTAICHRVTQRRGGALIRACTMLCGLSSPRLWAKQTSFLYKVCLPQGFHYSNENGLTETVNLWWIYFAVQKLYLNKKEN
jgi:hypothetical protein